MPVPWGTVRIEAIGAGGSVPFIDLAVSTVAAEESCVTVAVVPPDMASVLIRIIGDDAQDGESVVFDGYLEVPEGLVEVADVASEEFAFVYRVPVGNMHLRIVVDDVLEATTLTISMSQLIEEVAQSKTDRT